MVGTETPNDPVTGRVLYNTKHIPLTLLFILLCAPSARKNCLFVKLIGQGGSCDDKTHWVKEGVCQQLDKIYEGGK